MINSFGRRSFLCLLMAVVLAGCAAGVTRHTDAQKRQAYFKGGGKVARSVTVSLDKNAQEQLPDNITFDKDQFLATVKRLLDAKGLLAKTPDEKLPTIEIVVTDIRVRSNLSAILWGFMAGDDHIIGEVIARNPEGKELQRFQVSASYALGGLGGGQDNTRMGWLYETFAQEMANELTGTTPPSQ